MHRHRSHLNDLRYRTLTIAFAAYLFGFRTRMVTMGAKGLAVDIDIESVPQIKLLETNGNRLNRWRRLSLFANGSTLGSNGRITKHPTKQVVHIELKWESAWRPRESRKAATLALHHLFIRHSRFIVDASFFFIRQNVAGFGVFFELFWVTAVIGMMNTGQFQIRLLDGSTVIGL